MNHLNQLKAMLNAINVKYVDEDWYIDHYKERYPNIGYCIVISNSDNLGYAGFESVWVFDKDGNLLGTGAYE